MHHMITFERSQAACKNGETKGKKGEGGQSKWGGGWRRREGHKIGLKVGGAQRLAQRGRGLPGGYPEKSSWADGVRGVGVNTTQIPFIFVCKHIHAHYLT